MTETVAVFHYRHEAEYAKGFLDDAGIESLLLIDDAGGANMGLSFANVARLVVSSEDAEKARDVLAGAGLGEEDG